MRNKFETDIYKQLVRRFGKGNVDYEPCSYSYFIRHSYTPDFRICSDDNSRQWFVESKGYFRREDMRNIRAVKECNPELDLRLLFQRDSKYTKTMKYSDWANKYDFPYAVAKVPSSW